jgi:hypothetical protein
MLGLASIDGDGDKMSDESRSLLQVFDVAHHLDAAQHSRTSNKNGHHIVIGVGSPTTENGSEKRSASVSLSASSAANSPVKRSLTAAPKRQTIHVDGVLCAYCECSQMLFNYALFVLRAFLQ